MPQMMPIAWLQMYFTVSFLLLIFMSVVYFSCENLGSSLCETSSMMSLIWKW